LYDTKIVVTIFVNMSYMCEGLLGFLGVNKDDLRARVLAKFCGEGQVPSSCTCPDGSNIPFPPEG
jgi:hypothetical protein